MPTRVNCISLFLLFSAAIVVLCSNTYAQSLGNTGTIQGVVTDPTGAVIPGAIISVKNSITGYKQETKSEDDGSFRLVNLPPNPYVLEIRAAGFAPFTWNLVIRGSLPAQVSARLSLKGAETVVNVRPGRQDLIEINSTAHSIADKHTLDLVPVTNPAQGLSDAALYSTGAAAADGSGSIHPSADHAGVTVMVDNQPNSDQFSKFFSTQLPPSAIQSIEFDSGTPAAEFGDKSSLVAQITTRSALGSGRLFGNVTATYGTFGTVTGDIGLGYGNDKAGNFLAVDGVRSGRFLDTPELLPIHDVGNNESIFDRADFQVTPNDILHLNLFQARNWIQIPNTFDQLPQDQRQRVLTWSAAYGYQHIFNTTMMLSVNTYAREDEFGYFPSRNFFADTPATQSQNRHLLNYGIKSDLSKTVGRHSLKFGIDLKQTRLLEEFGFGVTDPMFNSPCLNPDGTPDPDVSLTNPGQCTGALTPNPGFSPGLFPFDLSRDGMLFHFRGNHNINQYAFYAQDSMKAGNFLFSVGLRGDFYYGLSHGSQPEPRVGIAYNVKKTATVLRLAYARTFETPYTENLILSSATGIGGLAQNVFGATTVAPIRPAFRNQFNAGLQQAFGKWVLVDLDYFWKYTNPGYDFSTLLNTTINFPIAWHNSKLDGITGRVSTTDIHGFQAYYTFGHNRARYFPPETGGLISVQPPAVFRIDHDQAFQNTLNLRYQRPRGAEYIDWLWRFDSGLVVSGVPDVAAALSLTPNQQVDIGLACNGVRATLANPFNPSTPCAVGTSTLLTLPQTGTENDDHHPDRVKPRNVLNLGIGTENLLHSEGRKRLVASIQIMNLTNKVALYNFLSTFSGTHFLEPRSVTARLGYSF